ncbi:MAG: type II secretion system GspH family protein [Oscillospiraceae bacterium]|nr:type II secretion system GspH family protein [Oscillospiraceae bacterium]
MKNFMGRTMAKMNDNRKKGRKALKGFTLVEIIVVLVILAILAAAMIPALTGYIDKAKEKTAIAEARSIVTAAQTLASEKYAMDGKTGLTGWPSDPVKKDIMTLADVTSEKAVIGEVKVSEKGKVEKLVYTTSSEVKVTYQNGQFQVGIDGTTPTATPTTSAGG